MHDLVIRHGLVVDGTGAEPHYADIAIDGDRISRIGPVQAGRYEIDAGDHIVTPGFVDLHTHLDAQVGWDPMLTPLTWHGVTTAVLGNCGVTFAPCRPGDSPFLAGMMETVEDIPKDAILHGLNWNWEHYGQYLDELENLQPVINLAGLIGHCAVRYYVMGERSIEAQPSTTEMREIVDLVRAAMRDGAVGFSTSRHLGHLIPDGRQVPGTHAHHEELIEIAAAVGAAGGLMQNVMNMSDFESEMALLEQEARHARVLFSHYTGNTSSYGNKVQAKIAAMRKEGLEIGAMVIPRASGFLMGLGATLPWQGGAWDKLANMDVIASLDALHQAEFVAQLVKHAGRHEPRTDPANLYFLGAGDKPDYVAPPEQSLAALAQRAGEHPAQTFIRISTDSEGTALFAWRALNREMAPLAEAIASDYCLPGLGDAGAHVSQVMDAGWATFVMSHWHRDTGLLTLADAVRRLTGAPAQILGLKDRGTLATGHKADVNVIKLDKLNERMPVIRHDLRGGAPRFVQHATGYRATICNGQIVLENDTHTGLRAGAVLRHGG